jgi:putative acetyltransferase
VTQPAPTFKRERATDAVYDELVKRMYTRPSHRGRKIGERTVVRIEALAWSEGLTRFVLETGDRHHAAWKVYKRSDFTHCGPLLDYLDVTWSVFYDKRLDG